MSGPLSFKNVTNRIGASLWKYRPRGDSLTVSERSAPGMLRMKQDMLLMRTATRLLQRPRKNLIATRFVWNTAIPLGKVASWSTEMVKKSERTMCLIPVVAPFNINQNKDKNYKKCG